MAVIGVGLYIVVAAGILAFAAKYGLARSLVPHHAEALAKFGTDTPEPLLLILRSLYQVMAAALVSVAIFTVVLALGPVAEGQLWARLTASGSPLIVGVVASLVTLRFERATGVRAPYRAPIVLLIVGAVAFFLTA